MPPWKVFTILLSTDSPYKKGDTVTGRVYEFSDNFGTFVAVDDKYSARIPGFENTTALKIGDIIEAKRHKPQTGWKTGSDHSRKSLCSDEQRC